MEYTLDDKYKLIKEEVLKSKSKNPIEIVKSIMHKDFINIHGPEHHFLDGASFLVAYKNAGGEVDVNQAIDMLAVRTLKMPGAMCGFWGICGSTTSVGAVLSIIHETSPLTSNDYYKDNMELTASVIKRMSEIGGPRCCKRHAYLALETAIDYVKDKYDIVLGKSKTICEFKANNPTCLKDKCPYFR